VMLLRLLPAILSMWVGADPAPQGVEGAAGDQAALAERHAGELSGGELSGGEELEDPAAPHPQRLGGFLDGEQRWLPGRSCDGGFQRGRGVLGDDQPARRRSPVRRRLASAIAGSGWRKGIEPVVTSPGAQHAKGRAVGVALRRAVATGWLPVQPSEHGRCSKNRR